MHRYHNYSDIQRHLSESRALTDAAEAHGTLSGALCADSSYRLEDWLAEILPEDALAGSVGILEDPITWHAAQRAYQARFAIRDNTPTSTRQQNGPR